MTKNDRAPEATRLPQSIRVKPPRPSQHSRNFESSARTAVVPEGRGTPINRGNQIRKT